MAKSLRGQATRWGSFDRRLPNYEVMPNPKAKLLDRVREVRHELKGKRSCYGIPLSPLVPRGERGKYCFWRAYPGRRSFLACPGLLSGHPCGISVWLAALARSQA